MNLQGNVLSVKTGHPFVEEQKILYEQLANQRHQQAESRQEASCEAEEKLVWNIYYNSFYPKSYNLESISYGSIRFDFVWGKINRNDKLWYFIFYKSYNTHSYI